MQPVGCGLLLFPQGRLRFIAIPRILLTGDVAIEDGLMLEFVSSKPPGEGVLRPDDLAPYAESGPFEFILKFPLPGTWVADIDRTTWLNHSTIAGEGFA